MSEITREEAMAELYRRNAMSPEQKAAYEELMRRGVVTGLDRSMGQRLLDNLSNNFANSGAGYTQRQFGDSNGNGFDLGDIWGHDDNNNGWDFSDLGPKIRPGTPLDRFFDATMGEDRGYFRTTDGISVASQNERVRQASYDARARADPARNIGDNAAALLGMLGGSAASPESWVGPAAGGLKGLVGSELAGAITGRVILNAGAGAGTDALLQGANVSSGVQDRYSFAQTLGAGAVGGVLSLGGDVVVRPLADRVRRAFTDPIQAPALLPSEAPAPRVDPEAPEPEPIQLPDFASVAPVERGVVANLRKVVGEKGVPHAAADLGARVWTGFQDRAARLYTGVVDEMHPLVRLRDRMVNEIAAQTGARPDLLPSQDPMKLARGRHDVFNIGQMDILHGVHEYRTTKASGPALADIVTAAGARFERAGRTVADAVDELGKYAAARRALAEWGRRERGELDADPVRESRADLEAFVKRMDAEQPEFRSLSDDLNEYARGLLKKRLDSGRLDQATYDAALKARDFYTPLRRVMDAEAGAPTAGRNKGPAVKKFKGSERDIENPIVSLMEDTFRLAQQTRVNDLNLSLVSLAERLNRAARIAGGDENPFIRKVKTPTKKVTVSADEQAKANGAKADDLDDMDVFRAGELNDEGRPILYVWRNGKREAWEVVDPEWGQMAFDAISNMTKDQSDLLVDVVGSFTTLLSRTITRDPSFLVANFVRDALASWTLTDVVKPGEGLLGVADELRQADSSRLYNLGGGISGGEASQGVNSMLRTRDVTELARRFKWDQGAVKMRYASDLKGILRLGADAYRATELTETGSRRRVFVNAFKRAQKEGLNDYEAMLEAAFTARDYADFGRHGSRVYAARKIVTFLNPWIQGLDKLVRTAATDPASAVGRAYKAGGQEAALKAILSPLLRQKLDGVPVTRADKAALKLAVHAWTRMAAMGVFGLGLSAIMRDDPDYREASDRTRASHWVIPMGDGLLMRIPKPFELAVMSNAMERGYEAVHGDDPTAWERMWKGMVEMFAPPMDAPLLNAASGLATGVDPATGRQIAPPGTEDLPPELQYEWWTSQMARSLGDDMGVSPAKVDFFMKTMGGPFGAYALKMSDATDPDRPSGSWVDLPVARRFFSPSFRGSQDKRDFYARAGARTSELSRALNGIREYEERGQVAAAQAIFDDLDNPGRLFVTSQRGEAATDRLNPLIRARAFNLQVSRMMGELRGGEAPDEGDPLPPMTAQMRQMVSDQLEKIAVAEMGNAMIATGQPGFAQRNMRDRAALWAELEQMSPEVAREMTARLSRGSAQAYDYDAVMDLWPEVQRRIETQGVNADLDDLARQAKHRSGRRQRRQTEDESINAILFRLEDAD